MIDKGWIKLGRKIQEHWIWESQKPFDIRSAWIDLILSANHQDNKFPLGKEMVTVERGSLITSEIKLMDRWGWSKSKVRTFLKLLQNDEMIIKKSDHKKTTIFIVNYDIYQETKTTERPVKNQSKTSARPVRDTNKNVKNVKNEKKKDISPPASEEQNQYPEGVEFLSDGTVSYANVKRVWD